MVKYSLFFILFILVSCVTISNDSKKIMMKQDEIGVFNSSFRTDGYYYRESYNNNNKRNTIDYNLFNERGYYLYNFPRIVPADSTGFINYKFLHNRLKKDLKNPQPFIKKESVFFLNKNAQVWNTGVYRAEGNKIHIQSFGNYAGNYYLVNYYGKIENDTILKLVYEEKPKDTLIYKFMPCEVGEFKTYIEENAKKFWKY